MSDLKRHPAQNDPRALEDDPLEELARIVSGSEPYRTQEPQASFQTAPARPQLVRQSMPNQLSALEQELFSELRLSVDPERTRSRASSPSDQDLPPAPRVVPIPTAHGQAAPSAHGEAAAGPPHVAVDPRYGDSAYVRAEPRNRSGVAAGSYDPAFEDFFDEPAASDAALQGLDPAALAREAHAQPVRRESSFPQPAFPQPTFDEFDREEIAAAALEGDPLQPQPAPRYRHSATRPRDKRRVSGEPNGLLVAGIALGVFVMGGVGFLGWRAFAGIDGGGAPPTIQADTSKPMKVKPEIAAQMPTDPIQSAEKEGDKSRLVTRQEEPVDQVAGRAADGRNVRLVAPGQPTPGAPDQPRAVRTVVVRPDGTLLPPAGAPDMTRTATVPPVTRVDSPSAVLPQVRVDPGSVPTPTVQPPSVAVAPSPSVAPPAAAVPQPVAVAPPPPPAAPKPVVAAPTVAPPRVAAPESVAPRPVAATAPRPAPMPGSQTLAPASGAPLALGPVSPTRVASNQPVAAAPAPAPVASAPIVAAPAGDGQFVVQVAAQKSDSDARRAFADAQRKYPSVLGGRSLDVQAADLGARGTYYRARAVAGSRDEAIALCQQLKAQGGDCVVARR